MAINFSNIEELPGSGVRKFSRKGVEGTRIFKIAWGDQNELIGLLFPANAIVYWPGLPSLIVDEADIKPLKGLEEKMYNTAPASYDYAEVTVSYKTSPWDETFMERSITIGAEFVTYPGGTIYWDSDGNSVGEDLQAGIISPHIEYKITLSFVAVPPWAQMRKLIGKVNIRPLLAGPAELRPVPTECLLFLGAEMSQTMTTGLAVKAWKLELKFVEKNNGDAIDPKGWNHFLRPGEGDWERAVVTGGRYIYPLDFLDDIFAYVSQGCLGCASTPHRWFVTMPGTEHLARTDFTVEFQTLVKYVEALDTPRITAVTGETCLWRSQVYGSNPDTYWEIDATSIKWVLTLYQKILGIPSILARYASTGSITDCSNSDGIPLTRIISGGEILPGFGSCNIYANNFETGLAGMTAVGFPPTVADGVLILAGNLVSGASKAFAGVPNIEVAVDYKSLAAIGAGSVHMEMQLFDGSLEGPVCSLRRQVAAGPDNFLDLYVVANGETTLLGRVSPEENLNFRWSMSYKDELLSIKFGIRSFTETYVAPGNITSARVVMRPLGGAISTVHLDNLCISDDSPQQGAASAPPALTIKPELYG